ncbi:MAG TPA: hypothetical protein VFS81_15235, partial [Candidatus Binatia bacterium]|nr:hypothetical protein [Candidatus Binatia bacterium]
FHCGTVVRPSCFANGRDEFRQRERTDWAMLQSSKLARCCRPVPIHEREHRHGGALVRRDGFTPLASEAKKQLT